MLTILVQEYSLLSLPITCSCNSHIAVVGIEPTMTAESLSLGSLTTRNLIGTNLHFVSEQTFTLNFVTLTGNY